MGTIATGSCERILKKALQYVSDYWLPVNRQLAEKILDGVAYGTYDTDKALLARELSSDLGLFYGCIRELRKLLAESEQEFCPSSDLTIVIEEMDLDLIGSAIQAVVDAPSVHLVSEGDDSQVSRLLEAVLSSTTAYTLADGSGVSPGAASSLASLRQLGFALVAWNYPTVYQEALDQVSAGECESLDVSITERLGFSPLLLASRLAHAWGLPDELRDAALIPTLPLYEEAHIISATTATLSTICRVSEALARVQFEQYYPKARGEWDIALTEIERRLGPQGISKIRERCAVASRTFLACAPDVFRPGLLLDEQALHPESATYSSEDRNPYSSLCSMEVRAKIASLYALIPNSKPSEKALRFLMREVVPAAGFSGGCVYTIDPSAAALVPQLEIGTIELRTSDPVSYINDLIEDDPIPLAFLTTEGCKPIIAEHNREGFGCIASAFGRSQRLGVLYLELSLQQLKANDKQTMIHFQAVTCALVDCLGL